MNIRMNDDERAMVEACDEFGKKVLEPWVERVENGRVYTVEGNSGDKCVQRSYPVGYYQIYGYGTLCP